MSHAYIADRVAARFHGWPGIDPNEVKSDAVFILCNAAKKYQPGIGTKFTTYAWTAINNELGRLVNKERLLPVQRKTIAIINSFSSEFYKEFGYKPTVVRIARETGVRESDVIKTLNMTSRVDATGLADPNDEPGHCSGALESNDGAPEGYMKVIDYWADVACYVDLYFKEAYKCLKPRNRDIFETKAFYVDGRDQDNVVKELSRLYGVCENRINQIYRESCAKLRLWYVSRGLILIGRPKTRFDTLAAGRPARRR